MNMLDLINIIILILNLILTGINTYWAYKRTSYNKRVTEGSEKYWTSWKERQADIARKVIEGMSDEDIVILMKKLEKMRNAKRKAKTKNI